VILALAENAPATIEEKLEHAGVRCVRLDVYHTVPAGPSNPKTRLSTLGVDAVLLASPSAVTGFVNQVELDADADIYTIGPSTTAAAHAADLEVKAQAESPSLEGLMEAM
jgi:uroporphyrinogen-III synthase